MSPHRQMRSEKPGLARCGPLFSESWFQPNDFALFTLVIWLGCLFAGAIGSALQTRTTVQHSKKIEPILALQVQVELETVPRVEETPKTPDHLAPAPAPVPELITTTMLQPAALVSPASAVAFAIPFPATGTVAHVSAVRAVASVAKSSGPQSVPNGVQQLTFGLGEGKQPPPTYPPVARSRGQEGTVGVRLTVGGAGLVLEAEAVVPSPWPLLNEAALKVVRERWRFQPGSSRIYDVAIRFQLTK